MLVKIYFVYWFLEFSGAVTLFKSYMEKCLEYIPQRGNLGSGASCLFFKRQNRIEVIHQIIFDHFSLSCQIQMDF